MPRRVALALTALLLSTALSGAALAGPGDLGTAAADWNLEALSGGFHRLSDYQGQVVVLFIIGYG